MVLSNLLYLVGAIGVAGLLSAIVLLRHRRPRSLESSIELFSRELQALRPEHYTHDHRPRPVAGPAHWPGGVASPAPPEQETEPG